MEWLDPVSVFEKGVFMMHTVLIAQNHGSSIGRVRNPGHCFEGYRLIPFTPVSGAFVE